MNINKATLNKLAKYVDDDVNAYRRIGAARSTAAALKTAFMHVSVEDITRCVMEGGGACTGLGDCPCGKCYRSRPTP